MEICKWKYGASSPAMFMIDDLCNSWVDVNGNGTIEPEEDFGAAFGKENSSIHFLENEILKNFPKVKVNFYVPVGKRIGMLLNSPIKMYSAPINDSEESKEFFRKVHNNPNYELSYHGTTHGEVFEDAKDQKQEWECYESLEEAIETINEGKEIFKEVTGEYPKGGKYCGYIGDKYGDLSINDTNFLWWHRFWNKGIESPNYNPIYDGKELNPIKAFDVVEFGKNNVIDIPSTISGGIFNLDSNTKIKRFIKQILKFVFYKRAQKQLDFLLNNNLVISIQEHICPARDDGKRQGPNIFDDKKSLIQIFKYLSKKNVWYCTGTELAEYYYIRKNIIIKPEDNGFVIDTKNIKKELSTNEVSIKVDKKFETVIDSENNRYKIKDGIVTIKVYDGKYILKK